MIQRYTIYGHYDDDDDLVFTIIRLLDDCGEWVKYTDHIAELEAVKNRVCEWEERNDCIQAVIQYKPKCFPEIFATIISDYCPYCGGKIEIKRE